MHAAVRFVDVSHDSLNHTSASDSVSLPTGTVPEHGPQSKLFAAPNGSAEPQRLALMSWVRSQMAGWVAALVSIGCVLLAWHLATHYRLDFYVRFNNIPSPADVFAKVLEVNQSTKFINNIGISVRRILLGFAVATVLGVGLGLLIGRYHWVRKLSMPALEVFRPIPAIAWVPMSIMLWPSNEVSIVFITFLGAFFPILLNSIHGVEAIDPVLLRAPWVPANALCYWRWYYPGHCRISLPGWLWVWG